MEKGKKKDCVIVPHWEVLPLSLSCVDEHINTLWQLKKYILTWILGARKTVFLAFLLTSCNGKGRTLSCIISEQNE